jgi:hypothetical protein
VKCTEIAFVNEDPDVKDQDVKDYAEACGLQLKLHVAPEYDRTAVPVKFYASRAEVPATSALLPFLPQSAMDDPNAIAYHTSKDDRIMGIVCAALAVANGMDPGVAASHEVCELFKDPCCNATTWSADGRGLDDEICDGVQDGTYPITIGSGRVMNVSNFVTGAWHDPQDAQGPYDFNGTLTAPHSKTPGGYLDYVDGKGQRQQEGMMPAWRKRVSVRHFKKDKRRTGHMRATVPDGPGA